MFIKYCECEPFTVFINQIKKKLFVSLKKILFGGSYIFLFSFLASLLSYAIRIVLARNLSIAEYGLFFSVFAFVSFLLQFRDWGLNPALVKYVAAYEAKKQYGKIKSAIYSVFSTQFTLSIIMCAFIIFSAKILAVSFFKDLRAEYLLYYFCLYILISFFVTLLRSYFKGVQKFKIFGLSNFIRMLGILLSVYIFFYFNLGVYAPVFAYVVGWLVVFIIFLYLFLKDFNFFNHPYEDRKTVFVKLFKFGIFALFTDFGSKIIESSDTLMLTYFTNLELVGIYNIIIPTSMVLLVFINSIAEMIFPISSAVWEKNGKNSIRVWLEKISKLYYVFITPVIISVMFYTEEFLELIFKIDTTPQIIFTMRLLLGGMFFLSFANLNNYVIAGMGFPSYTTMAYSISAVVNIILNFILIPKFSILGAASATVISYVIVFLAALRFLKKKIDFRIDIFYIYPVFLFLVFFGAIWFLNNSLLNMWFFFRAPLAVSISFLIYAILLLLFLKQIRRDVFSLVRVKF